MRHADREADAEVRVAVQCLLDLDGRAPGLDQVRDPAAPVQPPVGVDGASVLGAEEAVLVERVLGQHLVVAAHQRDALDRDLAFLARRERLSRDRVDDPNHHARKRLATGALPQGRRRVGPEHRSDREGLAESVGGPRPVLVLLDARQPRERTRGVDLSQRGKITCGRTLVLHERLLLVRPGVDRRRALALDEVERGARLEGLLEQQATAGAERRAQRHGDARRPEERIAREDAIVGREPHDVGEAPALENGRALRVEHALRSRRRPRRVDEDAVVRRCHLGEGGVEELVGDALAEREQIVPGLDAAARRVEADARHAAELRERGTAQPAGTARRNLGVRCQQVVEVIVPAKRGLHQEQ
jgi:hypothetical protein